MSKYINLTRGAKSIVDDDVYEQLSSKRWFLHSGGYAVRNISTGGHRRAGVMYMHRLIMGDPANLQVDHINGNKLDNRRCNLRLCTNAENQRNRKPRSGRETAYKGVRWMARSNKWGARIIVNGREKSLGYYEREDDAARAYDTAARLYFGEFARTNFDTSEAMP